MYFPYLRGKQFELILLRNNLNLLKESGIHPIIEPVKSDFRALIRSMKAMDEVILHYTIIINPQVGKKPIPQSQILEKVINEIPQDNSNISLGYIMHPTSELSDLLELIERYNYLSFSIIHNGYTKVQELAKAIEDKDNINLHAFIGDTGKRYRRYFSVQNVTKVLIKDSFKSQKKNSLYPPMEHFSDLHLSYKEEEGMDGFGDFLTVGSDFSESGGPAYCVAIHLTYIHRIDGDMYIFHFLSDDRDSIVNVAGKFSEALNKLVNKLNANNSMIFKSSACAEFVELYNKGHYPGLGTAKKLSMQHHIELMANYISNIEE